MDLKEEPSLYKVGAYCHSCDQDYGVIDTILRNGINHSDDAWEQAEDVVEGFSNR